MKLENMIVWRVLTTQNYTSILYGVGAWSGQINSLQLYGFVVFFTFFVAMCTVHTHRWTSWTANQKTGQ